MILSLKILRLPQKVAPVFLRPNIQSADTQMSGSDTLSMCQTASFVKIWWIVQAKYSMIKDFVAQKWCTIVEIVHHSLATSLGYNLPEILLQIWGIEPMQVTTLLSPCNYYVKWRHLFFWGRTSRSADTQMLGVRHNINPSYCRVGYCQCVWLPAWKQSIHSKCYIVV